MTTRSNTFAIATLASAALIAGCKSSAPDDLPPVQAGVAPAAAAQATATGPTAPVPGMQEHFVQATNGQNVIYFDTDRYDIDSADAAALQTQAAYLQQYPQLRATVEGHADERGTREYNLALGERRANAAKNYLASLGIDANRLTTISYGKERPVALGSDPQAWAQNRRAVSVIVR